MSHVVNPTGRTRRNVLIALGALAALAVLVLAVVVLPKVTGDDEDGNVGGFHELRKDEFATALIEAREEAGSWGYLQAQTRDGKPTGVVEGRVAWDGEKYELAILPTTSADGEGEFRHVDSTWYYYSPSQNKKKPWLELDEKTELGKLLLEGIETDNDPRRQLEVFEDPSGFQVMGVENVGVAEAVHYRVTVPVERVKELTSLPVVGNPGDQQVYDVWVNEKDQIVKMLIPVTIAGIESEVVTTYTAYGDDVSIEAPPADQVSAAKIKLRKEAGKG